MRIFVALALPFITSGQASAQTANPSAPAVAAATAMIEAISPQTREKAAMDAQVANIRRGALIAQMIGANPRVREAAQKDKPGVEAMLGRAGAIQADALTPIFVQRAAAIRAATIQAYASQFTIAEMAAITAFYRTGPGAKLLTAQPSIAQRVNAQVNAQYGPNVEAAQKAIAPRIEAEVKKLIPDQPAAPAAPAARPR